MANELASQFNKLGYHAVVHASRRTDAGGLSAGVMVASARGSPLIDAMLTLPKEVVRPPKERFALTAWRGGLQQGILLGSVYLFTGEGAGEVKVNFLNQVGSVLRALHRPFILGGDFQMSPEALCGTNWLTTVDARAICAEEATYTAGEVSSSIDFFVASADIAHMCEKPVAAPHALISKHSPVRMRIIGKERAVTHDVIRKPVQIPTERPHQ